MNQKKQKPIKKVSINIEDEKSAIHFRQYTQDLRANHKSF